MSAAAAPFGRRKASHWFRRWHIRLKGHLLPFNSGLLAREALSHPFFGVGRDRAASSSFSITPNVRVRSSADGCGWPFGGIVPSPIRCRIASHNFKCRSSNEPSS